MNILITNDDNHESPLLHVLLAWLEEQGHSLTIVVPMEEQSWTAKAISRIQPLTCDEIVIQGRPGYGVTGYPADCANLGIHHLCKAPPDLLISGINAGVNCGAGFILSSGTIGACIESNLSGVPAVALSQQLSPTIMQDWMTNRAFTTSVHDHLEPQLRKILPLVLPLASTIFKSQEQPSTLNFNFPFHWKHEQRIVASRVDKARYGSLFEKRGAHFFHKLTESSIERANLAGADNMEVRAGNVCVSQFHYLDLLTEHTEHTSRGLQTQIDALLNN